MPDSPSATSPVTLHRGKPERGRKAHRGARLLFRLAIRLVLGIVLFVAVGLLSLQIPPLTRWTARTALSLANPWEGTSVSMGSVRGSWLNSLALSHVRIANAEESFIISIDTLIATYDLLALASGEIRVLDLTLRAPRVQSGFAADGSLTLLEPFQGEEETTPDTTPPLRITGGSLTVTRGEFRLAHPGDTTSLHLHADEIALAAKDIEISDIVRVSVDSLHFTSRTGDGPDNLATVDASGTLSDSLVNVTAFTLRSARSRVHGSGKLGLPIQPPGNPLAADFSLTAAPLAYRDLHPFVPGFGPDGEVFLSLQAMQVEGLTRTIAQISFPEGGSARVEGEFQNRRKGDLGVHLNVRVDSLSIAAITGAPDPSERLTGRVSLSGEGSGLRKFTGDISATVAESYLAGFGPMTSRLKGKIFGDTVSLDLTASLGQTRLTLRGPIAPLLESPTYNLRGAIQVAGRTGTPGSEILEHLAGFTGRFSFRGSGFDPATAEATLTAAGTCSDSRSLRAVDARVDLREGTATVALDAASTGGDITLRGEFSPGHPSVYMLRTLEFRNLDLGPFLGDALRSNLTGSLAARGSGTEPASLSADGALRLSHSTIHDVAIEDAQLRFRLAEGTADLRGTTRGEGGALSFSLSANLLARRPSATIREVAFQNLKPGVLLGTGSPRADLTGRLRAEAAIASADELSRLIDGLPERLPNSTRITADILLEQSHWNDQTLRGTLHAALFGRELGIDLDIRTPEGGVVARGSVRPWDPLPQVDLSQLEFNHLNIGALAGLDGVATDLTGSGSAQLYGETLSGATGGLSIDISASKVNDEALHSASVRATMREGVAGIHGETRSAQGTSVWDAEGIVSDTSFSGKMSAAIRFDELGPLLGAGDGVTGSMDIRVGAQGMIGNRDITHGDGYIEGRGRLKTLHLDSLMCRLSFHGGLMDVDTVLLTSNAGSVEAAGVLALLDTNGSPASDFQMKADIRSLKPLAGLAGIPHYTRGTGKLTLAVSGPPDATQMTAGLHVPTATLGDLSLTLVDDTTVAVLGSGFALKSLDSRTTIGALVFGATRIDRSEINLSSNGTVHRFGASLGVQHGIRSRIVGSVTEAVDSTVLALDTLTLRGPQRSWSLDSSARISFGPRIRVHNLSLRSGAREISAHGTLDPEGNQDFTFVADSLELGRMAEFLGRGSLGGVFSCDLRLTGPAEDVQATGTVRAEMFTDGRPLGTLTGRLAWVDSLLRVEGSIRQAGGGLLDARANIPRILSFRTEEKTAGQVSSPAQPMDIGLVAKNFDLRFLQPFLDPGTVSDLRGYLSADIKAQGQLKKLNSMGTIAIDSGLVRLPRVGGTYRDVSLLSTIDERTLVIERATVFSGEGSLRGSGRIDFSDIDTLRQNLRFTVQDFLAIQNPTVKATLSGNLNIGGTLTDPVVTGDIEVKDSYFIVPEESGGGTVEAVDLTEEDYDMLAKNFAVAQRPAAEEENGVSPSPLRPTLDLNLSMGRNTWVRKRMNPKIAIELLGNIAVTSRPDQPLTIFGILRPKTGRSFVGQFGREFEIREGEIAFNGPPEDLELRIESEYKVPSASGSGLSEVVIRMGVESKLGRFTFRLSSDPAMEEADILSYLATGKAHTGALARTGDQGNLGSAAALEQLVGAAGGLTEGKIPLDVFQIRQDGARGITIVAGNYPTPRTYLGIRQPILINQGTLDTYYDVRTQFEVEYQASSWLFFNFQGGSSRTLLLLKSRYAY